MRSSWIRVGPRPKDGVLRRDRRTSRDTEERPRGDRGRLEGRGHKPRGMGAPELGEVDRSLPKGSGGECGSALTWISGSGP